MLFANIDYLDSNFEIKNGFVVVEGAHITYVGKDDPSMQTPTNFGERYDGRGKLLMPGFYNAHAHAPMTLLRGYAENLSLHTWLNTHIFPFESKMTDAEVYPATLLAIAEMLRFGTVSFSDMYYFGDARIRAIAESGIKANVSHSVLCFDERSYEELPDKAITDALIAKHHSTLDGRLKIDLSIHAEYTSTPKVVEALGQSAVDYGVGTQIHLSETRLEHQECKQRHKGKTPAEYFDSLGFFRMPCTAAHCVYAEPSDWDIFATRGVTVAANPVSNMKLASGFAPIPAMLNAGVNIALGTDGVASNNNHNIMQDLYVFALAYKGSTQDPTVITAQHALKAASINGAHAQGRLDCGAITPGNRADLIVLDVSQPWMKPVNSQLNNLVYSAQGSDIILTMVDGEVLYRDGMWPSIDIERVIAASQKATEHVQSQL